MPRLKRLLQTLMLVAVIAYISLFVYQRSISVANQKLGQELGWQERAPRSLSKDYEVVEAVSTGISTQKEHSGSVANTAVPKAPLTQLPDIFISVKTTAHYHKWRLPVILKTWFQLAKDQTWFFTDINDMDLQKKTNGHMINTNCSSSHNRKALCCKMSVEFDVFLESDKKWFCHFDDDNYVNVPRLVKLLSDYNPQEDWYLGKPSIRAPLEILNRETKTINKVVYKMKQWRYLQKYFLNRVFRSSMERILVSVADFQKHQIWQSISFWFATGGAGFCLSRALALKMMPLASHGKFMSIGEKIRLPDDVTMGYIIEHMLRKPLTVVDQFHSHLEPMKFLRQETFHDQITFSYSRYSKDEVNVVKIDGFDVRIDPTRFLSLHCFLFAYFPFCPR